MRVTLKERGNIYLGLEGWANKDPGDSTSKSRKELIY